MKAILKYNLPEEEKEFNRAARATDMALALVDIEQYFRNVEKYETKESIEQIREKFYNILTSYDINLDNLIE